MQVTVEIPETLARSLRVEDADLSRRVLETLAAEEYRSGRLTKPQLRESLGLETSYELDGFLKRHQIWIERDEEGVDEDLEDMERLGL